MLSHTSRSAVLVRLIGPVMGLALAVGACSSGGATNSPSAAAASAPASASAAAAGGLTIATGTGAAGTYLTGDNGMTLYTYKPDGTDSSTCVDQCATNWPPLVVTGSTPPRAGSGVSGKIATFKRPDGGTQVSYNGKPLYYFVKDKAAGDTTGDKVGGVWFLATP